jgi:hypothetical protein
LLLIHKKCFEIQSKGLFFIFAITHGKKFSACKFSSCKAFSIQVRFRFGMWRLPACKGLGFPGRDAFFSGLNDIKQLIFFVCFFFCLDAKETKNQGKPDRSARFSRPARGISLFDRLKRKDGYFIRRSGGR